MNYIGTWWNDNNIPLVKINENVYALCGWDGEKYTKCWKCNGEYYMSASSEEYTLIPEYDNYTEIIGFEVISN